MDQLQKFPGKKCGTCTKNWQKIIWWKIWVQNQQETHQNWFLSFLGGSGGHFSKKPLNCQFSKGVPYMILELCKCGKSFSQIYKAYNFLKDHVRQSIEVELRERENFSPYMYTIIKTKHLIGACNSTRVKKSYFGHTFHLTQKSFLVGGWKVNLVWVCVHCWKFKHTATK